MVGFMIVSLAVALLLAVADTKSCSDLGDNYHDYVDGSCIYLDLKYRQQAGVKQWNLASGKESCRNLNKYPYEWRVPKVDTSRKLQRLRAITPKPQRMWFYVDLVGDERMDDSSWKNTSMWYWLPDNTTTLASYDGKVPWGEATNRPEVWRNGYPKARCALLYKRVHDVSNFYVATCEEMPIDNSWGDTMVVCESIDVSKTTTSATTTTTPTTTTPTTTTPTTTTSTTTTPTTTTPTTTTPTTTTPTTTTPTTTTPTTTTPTTKTPTTTTPTTTTPTTTTPIPTSKEAQSPTKPVATGPTDVARSINETQSSEKSSGRYNWAIFLLIGLNVLFCAVVAAIFYKTRNHEYQSLDDGMSGDVIRDGEMPSSSSVNSSSRKVAPRKVKKRK